MIINSKNRQVLQIGLFVLVAIIVLGIGYASITAINLIINGNATASVNQNNFIVHFIEAQNITGITGVAGTSIIESDDTKASFNVTGLSKIGDYAEAKYVVKNDSNGIGAEITLELTNSNSEYFKVTEAVQDNKLQAGETTLATVKVEMIKTPVDSDASTSVTAKLTASPLENNSATEGNPVSKSSDDPESFATDSWATIQKAIRNNNTSAYNLGDTKNITINNTNYTLRLVNKTTGEHCGDEETAYSQTACGFVVEFVNIVESRSYNSPQPINTGGYPGSDLYTYLQGDFYNSLPDDLKSVIKPTRVISGYGCRVSSYVCTNPDNNGNNFVTTDNLYLYSGVELVGEDPYDTAAATTHQIEYYVGKSNNDRIKKIQINCLPYWMRTAYSLDNANFRVITSSGELYGLGASIASYGMVPAFRIG